jgi:hypothetical protein
VADVDVEAGGPLGGRVGAVEADHEGLAPAHAQAAAGADLEGAAVDVDAGELGAAQVGPDAGGVDERDGADDEALLLPIVEAPEQAAQLEVVDDLQLAGCSAGAGRRAGTTRRRGRRAAWRAPKRVSS